jgi:hypothetical protein
VGKVNECVSALDEGEQWRGGGGPRPGRDAARRRAVGAGAQGATRSLAPSLPLPAKPQTPPPRTPAPHPPPPPAQERVSRVEAETKTVRQVGSDLLRLQERLESDKAARDAEMGQLRGELHEVLGNRNVTDEKFQVGRGVRGG